MKSKEPQVLMFLFPNGEYVNKIKEIRVIDGNTVECTLNLGYKISNRVIVRLSGLNCPEMNSKDKETKAKAKAAKEAARLWLGARYLAGLMLNSKDLDKYGRSIGVIHYGDETLNSYLIDSGHAEPKDYDEKRDRKPNTRSRPFTSTALTGNNCLMGMTTPQASCWISLMPGARLSLIRETTTSKARKHLMRRRKAAQKSRSRFTPLRSI